MGDKFFPEITDTSQHAWNSLPKTEAYLGCSQTSMIELFEKIAIFEPEKSSFSWYQIFPSFPLANWVSDEIQQKK